MMSACETAWNWRGMVQYRKVHVSHFCCCTKQVQNHKTAANPGIGTWSFLDESALGFLTKPGPSSELHLGDGLVHQGVFMMWCVWRRLTDPVPFSSGMVPLFPYFPSAVLYCVIYTVTCLAVALCYGNLCPCSAVHSHQGMCSACCKILSVKQKEKVCGWCGVSLHCEMLDKH